MQDYNHPISNFHIFGIQVHKRETNRFSVKFASNLHGIRQERKVHKNGHIGSAQYVHFFIRQERKVHKNGHIEQIPQDTHISPNQDNENYQRFQDHKDKPPCCCCKNENNDSTLCLNSLCLPKFWENLKIFNFSEINNSELKKLIQLGRRCKFSKI